MSRQNDWLQSEIKSWISDGLIDQSTGQLLAARYPVASGRSWGFFLLTAIGAIIFGLGVILFFAYNWAVFPKWLKLACIIMVLAVFHLLGWLFGQQKSLDGHGGNEVVAPENLTRRNLSEGFHLIGTMMFGAGIFLIAQIYNIDEHYPNAFLFWGVGALIFAWAIPSVIQGLIATVLIGAWGATEVLDFKDVHVLSIALVLFGIIPLAWMHRSRTLLLFSLIVTLGLMLVNADVHVSHQIVLHALFSISVLLIASAYAAPYTSFPASADVFRGVGVAVYGFIVFALTFSSNYLDNLSASGSILESTIFWSLLGLSALVWVALCIGGFKARFALTKSLQHVLIFLTVLVMLTLEFDVSSRFESVFPLIFDVILASHAVLLIIRGTDNLLWQQVAIGCITLGVLVFVRFNDLFHSLLMRSLVFVLLGAALFLIGHLYSKRKMRVQSNA